VPAAPPVEESAMLARIAAAILLAVTLAQAAGPARAGDEMKFPDWSGQWRVLGGNRWDPSKRVAGRTRR
jgi:hypothetical protein